MKMITWKRTGMAALAVLAVGIFAACTKKTPAGLLVVLGGCPQIKDSIIKYKRDFILLKKADFKPDLKDSAGTVAKAVAVAQPLTDGLNRGAYHFTVPAPNNSQAVVVAVYLKKGADSDKKWHEVTQATLKPGRERTVIKNYECATLLVELGGSLTSVSSR